LRKKVGKTCRYWEKKNYEREGDYGRIKMTPISRARGLGFEKTNL